MSVGAIEGRFYSELIKGLGIDASSLPHQNDMQRWPEMRDRFAEVFRTKTRDEWTAVFEGKDACVAPVLDLNEVDKHPHNRERQLIMSIDGVPQPAPAPRLSRTPGKVKGAGKARGSDLRDVLTQLGYSKEEIKEFLEKDIVDQPDSTP